MSADVRILVADDHPLFRQGVVATLAREPDFTVVGETETIRETLTRVRLTMPDIVLLDVALPDGSGVDAIAPILSACPGTKVVMLTSADDSDTVLDSLRAGAAGYLVKGAAGGELVAALRSIGRGEGYTSPRVASRLLAEVAHPRSAPGEDLTPREHTVFQMLGQGLTNREIAQGLYLSEKTVKRHVTVVMQKLGVRNRVEAALVASRERRPGRPR
jgi:DNA-binding NarL/FixJ family response regulator